MPAWPPGPSTSRSPAGTSISSSWDADITSLGGNSYRATKKSWAGALAPGRVGGLGLHRHRRVPGAVGLHHQRRRVHRRAEPAAVEPARQSAQPPSPGNPSPSQSTSQPPTNPGAKKVVGYFVEWGVYQRNYHVKNIHTSGSAAKMTHILYAFGNPTDGRCGVYDSYADYEKAYTAAESVDGVADTWDQPLRGSFNQLRKLKKMYPHLKILWSFGGWTLSRGFTQAAQNPQAFADSCYNLVEDPRWADVFDGIDIDWEYPNACGLSLRHQRPERVQERDRGAAGPVRAEQPGDGGHHGRRHGRRQDRRHRLRGRDAQPQLDHADDVRLLRRVQPAGPHGPALAAVQLRRASRRQNFNADAAIQKLKSKGVPASKILFGVGFYGRGWTGVTQAGPGGSATGPAPGTYEPGNDDYKVLKNRCPSTGTIGGTAYAKCGNEWWGYDTPATIGGKMTYANQQGLGGAFFWELSGDTDERRADRRRQGRYRELDGPTRTRQGLGSGATRTATSHGGTGVQDPHL